MPSRPVHEQHNQVVDLSCLDIACRVWIGGERFEVGLGLHGQQIEPHAPENNRKKTVRFREGAFYE